MLCSLSSQAQRVLDVDPVIFPVCSVDKVDGMVSDTMTSAVVKGTSVS